MTTRQAAARPAPSAELTADIDVASQRIHVADLTISCKLGVSEAERATVQRIRINVELEVRPERPLNDDPRNVVDYRGIVPAIRDITQSHTPRLLETLADRIAEVCLGDSRAISSRVRIDKLDRYADASGIGVEVHHRKRQD